MSSSEKPAGEAGVCLTSTVAGRRNMPGDLTFVRHALQRDDAQELTDAKRRTDFESCAKLLSARKKISGHQGVLAWHRRFPKLITTAPVAA